MNEAQSALFLCILVGIGVLAMSVVAGHLDAPARALALAVYCALVVFMMSFVGRKNNG